MGTRAFIISVKPNQKFDVMYVHHEGYPEWMMPILTTSITTTDQLKCLLKFRGITRLGQSPLVAVSHYEDGKYVENDFATRLLVDEGSGLDCVGLGDIAEYLRASWCLYFYVAVPKADGTVSWEVFEFSDDNLACLRLLEELVALQKAHKRKLSLAV